MVSNKNLLPKMRTTRIRNLWEIYKRKKQETSPPSPHYWITTRDYPLENVLGDIRKGVSTRSQVSNFCGFTALVSQIEPKTIKEAIVDKFWTLPMQDELNQFKRNEVWDLVPFPKGKSIIGTKWVF